MGADLDHKKAMARVALALGAFLFCLVVANATAPAEYPVPIGEDDEAENFDLTGERAAPTPDVYLQEGEDAPAKKKTAKLKPIIELSGGGEFHVGPQATMKTVGGQVNVKKGSKMAVSQGGKLITQE